MKTLFVLATVMVALFLAAPNKVEAQKRKAAAKVIEGTVIGLDGTKYVSQIIVESGGKRYFVTTWQLNARKGTTPTIIGGDDYSIGTRVRVTYISTYDADTNGITDVSQGYAMLGLNATRIVRLDSRRVDTASMQTDENGFQVFFTEFCSAVRKHDRAALELMMSSTIELPVEIVPPSLALDYLGRDNGRLWKQVEESVATGTKPYKDSSAQTVTRATNDNLILFGRSSDGKWRWLRLLRCYGCH